MKKKKYSYERISEPVHVNKVLFSKIKRGEICLIQDIVPKGGITAISGHPGSGKTWLYYFMALSVATGIDFLDRFKTVKGSVLIVDEESGPEEITRRNKMIGSVKDKGIFFLVSNGVKLDDEHYVQDLIQFVQRKKIKLVIFDPFVSFHNKSENDAGEMQSVMESMVKLNRKGATVIFVHHHRKDGISSKSTQSLRGSSAFSGRVDSHLSVEKVSDDNNQIRIIIRQEKMRRGKRIEPIEVIFKEEGGQMIINYLGNKEPDKLKKDLAKEYIVNILKKDFVKMTTEELSIEINKDVEVGIRNINEAIKELENEFKINFEREGRKKVYFINTQEIKEEVKNTVDKSASLFPVDG